MSDLGEALQRAVDRAESDLRRGELASARARLETALAEQEAPCETVEYRRAVNMLGAAYFELGLLEAAEQQFARVLDLANRADDPLTLGRATNNLGLIANMRGRHDEALTRYQLAVPAFQRGGSTKGMAETCHNLAITWRDKGRLDEADRYERRAIDYAQEAGDRRLLAMAQVGRAELSLRRGEAAVAEAGARLGAAEYAAIPDALGQADALRLAGAARTELNEFASAREALDQSLALAKAHGATLLEAEALGARARLGARLGQWDGAREDGLDALRLLERLGAEPDRTVLQAWLAGLGPAAGP